MTILAAYDSWDLGGQLHMLICAAWTQALSPADRAAQPLARYVLSEGLLASVSARRVDVPVSRIAWVCAMVACGLAPRLRGLEPHPLLTGNAGAQLVRRDDGKGWRCNLKRNASGGPRLHYWVLPDGRIDFTAVGAHDELGRR